MAEVETFELLARRLNTEIEYLETEWLRGAPVRMELEQRVVSQRTGGLVRRLWYHRDHFHVFVEEQTPKEGARLRETRLPVRRAVLESGLLYELTERVCREVERLNEGLRETLAAVSALRQEWAEVDDADVAAWAEERDAALANEMKPGFD